jgi:hypothetical protein
MEPTGIERVILLLAKRPLADIAAAAALAAR